MDENGLIIGHSHVVIQKLADDDTSDEEISDPPSAQSFVFFKGLNQDDQAIPGRLSITVSDGIQETGIFRICTMTSSSGHQPVLMPVARRGSQDDCVRVKVIRGKRNPKAKKVDEDVTPEELRRARKRRNAGRRRAI